jgi:hypothetical protein
MGDSLLQNKLPHTGVILLCKRATKGLKNKYFVNLFEALGN